jgi:hypothetical protein
MNGVFLLQKACIDENLDIPTDWWTCKKESRLFLAIITKKNKIRQ